MLNNLNEQKLLGFINRNVKVRLREFQDGKLKLDSPVETRDLVHKFFNIYVLVLPRHARLILFHLSDNWFRAVAYFNDHDTYINFLNIIFSNF